MRLYLDDDSVDVLLIRLLRRAGHDVETPTDVGQAGGEDPVYFRHAIRTGRSLLTHNHHDFELLHDLVLESGGHHAGMLVVRKDNNPKRDLKPGGIVSALAKVISAGVQLPDHVYVLNQWR